MSFRIFQFVCFLIVITMNFIWHHTLFPKWFSFTISIFSYSYAEHICIKNRTRFLYYTSIEEVNKFSTPEFMKYKEYEPPSPLELLTNHYYDWTLHRFCFVSQTYVYIRNHFNLDFYESTSQSVCTCRIAFTWTASKKPQSKVQGYRLHFFKHPCKSNGTLWMYSSLFMPCSIASF